MSARLIVNPKAGSNRGVELRPALEAALRRFEADVDVVIAAEPDDLPDSAARALEEGYDALYVAGGDGTLNAVLRGLVPSAARDAPLPTLGVIPLGTGNDFAKALDLGEEPFGAIDRFRDRRMVGVDIGLMNDRPFVNTSAGGFVADVSESVTEGLKDATGKLAYLIGGARALFGTEPFSARLQIHDGARGCPQSNHPGRITPLDLQMFAVCNARFIGGGYPIAPDALIDDGLLDVLVVPRMSRIDFVGVLQRIAAGDYEATPGILHFRAAAFDLEFDRAVRVNTDGEPLEATSCRYRVHGRQVPFFCGPDPHAAAPAR